MSRAIVGMVIESCSPMRDLRIRFALDRIETVADLCLRGFDLTRDEIDLLCRTDAVCGSWRPSASRMAAVDRHARYGVP